jgi:hypothetical protein
LAGRELDDEVVDRSQLVDIRVSHRQCLLGDAVVAPSGFGERSGAEDRSQRRGARLIAVLNLVTLDGVVIIRSG